MPLTREFKETVQARLRTDRKYRKELLRVKASSAFSPSGNPQARNLFEVIHHLQRAEGLHFELSLRAAS